MRFRSWGILAAVLVLVGIAAAGGGATTPVLVVTDDDGSELLAVPVTEGSQVGVEYTHSVEKTLVTDVYVVDDGALAGDRMAFSSYGAGLPSEAAVNRTDGRYVTDLDGQRHETLRVSTGPVARQELIVDGDRHDLYGLAEGGSVRLRIEYRYDL